MQHEPAGQLLRNAPIESWHLTLNSELGEQFESYAAANEQPFDYIEVFYSQQRRHSALGYDSPAKYERSARMTFNPLGLLSTEELLSEGREA